MLGTTNEWYILEAPESGFTFQIITFGDTILRNKVYKTLGIRGYSNTIGFIREDTIEKKIYLIPYNSIDTMEIVYYDFSLNENDSIMLYDLNYESFGYYKVDSVRNISTLAGNRRALYLSNDDWRHDGKPVWVEEIGSLRGINRRESTPYYIFEPYAFPFWGEGFLTCSFKNGIKIFQADYYELFDTCAIFWYDVENIYLRDEVKIYPNPAISKLNIELNHDLPFEVFIYHPFGSLIYQGINQKTIDLDLFSSGIYIVKIKLNKAIVTKKLLVIK
jgi:hypothetical protein